MARYINRPDKIVEASNKFSTLVELTARDVPTVPWTQSIDSAVRWLQSGDHVYARSSLSGHSGAGIEVINPDSYGRDGVPHVPLYTKAIGFNKRHEYRIHVIGRAVAFCQKKKRANGWKDNPNFSNAVRNHHTGWIYSHENLEVPESVKNAALQSVEALGLDFGAVDIIYFQDQPYVLEVNTAPGLEGTTLDIYAEKMYNLIRSKLV